MKLQIFDLSLLGGKLGDYTAKGHYIEPFRAAYIPESVIKLYSMRSLSQESFSQETMDTVGDLLSTRIRERVINPRLGMGFAIVSNGFVNVSMWGGEAPSILNNNLFGFDKIENMRETLKPLDTRDFGSYCVWELGIVAHEASAWRRYLKSQKDDTDKIRYIEDVFKGVVI